MFLVFSLFFLSLVFLPFFPFIPSALYFPFFLLTELLNPCLLFFTILSQHSTHFPHCSLFFHLFSAHFPTVPLFYSLCLPLFLHFSQITKPSHLFILQQACLCASFLFPCFAFFFCHLSCLLLFYPFFPSFPFSIALTVFTSLSALPNPLRLPLVP